MRKTVVRPSSALKNSVPISGKAVNEEFYYCINIRLQYQSLTSVSTKTECTETEWSTRGPEYRSYSELLSVPTWESKNPRTSCTSPTIATETRIVWSWNANQSRGTRRKLEPGFQRDLWRTRQRFAFEDGMADYDIVYILIRDILISYKISRYRAWLQRGGLRY